MIKLHVDFVSELTKEHNQSNIVFCVEIETMKLVASRRVKVEKVENEMKVQVIKTTLRIRVFSVEFSLSFFLSLVLIFMCLLNSKR